MKGTDERIKEIFKKYNCWYDWDSYEGEIEVHVRWGDWKHDHIFLDHIMKEGGFVPTGELATEEDGSDCYSSVHYYREQQTT